MSGAPVIHFVHLDDVPPQPWRNGGGVTRELLAWSPDGPAAEWALRVSVADIDRDGPFSAFPGIDRHFAVLEGEGVVLGEPGAERLLTASTAPWSFAGESAPACRLRLGPTRDLNLMVRRAGGRGTLVPVAGPGLALAAGPAWRAVYARQALVLRRAGDEAPFALPAHALAWSAHDDTAWHLAPASAGEAPPPVGAPAGLALAWWPTAHAAPDLPPPDRSTA
ncbi:MAG: HutD family protein [Burkholderiales bacterium]|nr:HutD family protein [Burkholderiales bacterium]